MNHAVTTIQDDTNMNNSRQHQPAMAAVSHHAAYMSAMYPLVAPPLVSAVVESIAPPPSSFPQHISFPTYVTYNNDINTSNQTLTPLDPASSGTDRIMSSSSCLIGNYPPPSDTNTSSCHRQPTTTSLLNDNNNNNDNMMMMSRTLNEREQFFCFVKILFKLLQQPSEDDDDANQERQTKAQQQLQRCQRIVRDCTLRNRQGDPDCRPLVDCLRRRLRPVIDEHYWRQAELVLRRSLEQKAERQQQQAQTIIPTAV